MREEIEFLRDSLTEEEFEKKVNEIAEIRTRKEIKAGVQTIVYQINTLMCTNGFLNESGRFKIL